LGSDFDCFLTKIRYIKLLYNISILSEPRSKDAV